MQLYNINKELNRLEPIQSKTLASAGYTEPKNLEAWILGLESGIFSRDILWIMKQDHPNSDQRSDLIGISRSGSTVICELKRGTCEDAAIIQALGYAAEYADFDVEDFARKYLDHSHGDRLPSSVTSFEEAVKSINAHVTARNSSTEVKVNDEQTIILVAEDFSPQVLAIANYLNNATEQSTYSIEYWRYQIFDSENGTGQQFALEQTFPPQNIRAAIAEKREERRGKKYARDPARMQFIRDFMAHVEGLEKFYSYRNSGASYVCTVINGDYDGAYFYLDVSPGFPRLWVPTDIGDIPFSQSDIDGPYTVKKDESGTFIELNEHKSGKPAFNESVFASVKDAMDKFMDHYDKILGGGDFT